MARPFPWLVPAVVAGGLAPVLELSVRAVTGGLGADPVAFLLNRLGLVALVFLVAGLCCTPCPENPHANSKLGQSVCAPMMPF